MARDGAPGARDADFLKVLILPDGFLRRLDDFLWNAGVRDEDAAQVQVFFSLQAVGNVCLDAGLKCAAIFFADVHLAVRYFNGRAEP